MKRCSSDLTALALAMGLAAGWASSATAGPPGEGVIDFEGLPAGTIVSELSKGQGITGNVNGVVRVIGHNTIFPNTNAAIIFDSDCPVTPTSDCDSADLDLGSPHQTFGGPGRGSGGAAGSPFQNDTALGNILVLAKDLVDNFDNNDGSPGGDGLIDDPDDADRPGFINFDFSDVKKNGGTITINSFTIMDIEFSEGESPALVEFSGPGIITATIAVIDTGNGGVATIDGIGLSGVDNVRVNVKGSSAFVGIDFGRDDNGRDCWITTGGFQNAGVKGGSKDFTFGGNVGPPPSGSWQVVDHNTGDNFHSNDVSIVNCVEIVGTGPGQPGGKKGFAINQAFFEGTGRLNNVPGFPFEGFVIDRGEPSGKLGNDTDEFEIVVFDPVTNAVVFEASGPLDGGNVQIHPPVP